MRQSQDNVGDGLLRVRAQYAAYDGTEVDKVISEGRLC